MRRYDYYPFGMEIMSRSGDFSQVDYSSDVYELLYEGLLKSCDAYDTVDVSVSTADSIHCVTANNIYGQAYVDTIFLDHYKETQAWSGMHKFEFSVDMKLSEVIPDLDSAGSYLIEFDFESQGRFITCEAPWSGVQSSPGVTTSSDIRRAEAKSLAISFKGYELDSLAMNGAVYFKFKASWAESGHPYDTYAKITNIKVTQIFKNTSTQLAMRDGSAYSYGFNSYLRDDEISGSGNAYNTEFRGYDARLGRWRSIDPLADQFPWQSPYVAFDNNPINVIDPKGLAGEDQEDKSDKPKSSGLTQIVIQHRESIKVRTEIARSIVHQLDLPESISKEYATQVISKQITLSDKKFEEREMYNNEKVSVFVGGKFSINTSQNKSNGINEREISTTFLDNATTSVEILNDVFKPSNGFKSLAGILFDATEFGDATTSGSELTSTQVKNDFIFSALKGFVANKLDNKTDFTFSLEKKITPPKKE